MPEYDRIRDGKDISDLSEQIRKEILDVVIESQKLVQLERGANFGDPDVYVFGSWARGTAIEGVSDIDLALLYFPQDFTEFKQEQMWATGDIMEELVEQQTERMDRLFDGYDVGLFHIRNSHLLNDKFTESRSDRPEGTPQIYNLNEMRFRTDTF